jgi:Fe-S cluster assembly protein SufD
VLIIAEANAEASLVESYAGLGTETYLTNAISEISVGENAALDHYRVQREAPAAFHISATHVREERAAQFRSTSITLGGRLTRNHVHTALVGEGIDSTLNGLYVEDGTQHVDNHTLIEHAQPNCQSHEFYKGILGGKATGVFRGKIHVHQAAQKTDAYQTNQNLLLSDSARIDTKPQLEIYADDVKCSHGATIGQLDQDAIFYLRSRGIGHREAVRVLTRAFAGEVLDRVRVDPLRDALDDLVTQRLDQTAAVAL